MKDAETGRSELIRQLQGAFSGELAAGHAYHGHAASVSSPEERARILRIEEEEWVHRRNVGEMLSALDAGPDHKRERTFFHIGRTIAFLCRIGGWYFPMYGAGRLESTNVREYEVAADSAVAAGHSEFVECLLEMAEVEWEHERFFREKALSHPLRYVVRVWPELPPKSEIRAAFARRNPEFASETRAPVAV